MLGYSSFVFFYFRNRGGVVVVGEGDEKEKKVKEMTDKWLHLNAQCQVLLHLGEKGNQYAPKHFVEKF